VGLFELDSLAARKLRDTAGALDRSAEALKQQAALERSTHGHSARPSGG